MKSSVKKRVLALCLICIGVFFALAGIYIGETDDAPGAALVGIVLMIGFVVYGLKIALKTYRNSDHQE